MKVARLSPTAVQQHEQRYRSAGGRLARNVKRPVPPHAAIDCLSEPEVVRPGATGAPSGGPDAPRFA